MSCGIDGEFCQYDSVEKERARLEQIIIDMGTLNSKLDRKLETQGITNAKLNKENARLKKELDKLANP